jgi:uridylate kinase
LLKLSGESLAGKQTHGIDFDKVLEICRPVKECADMGVQIGIVVGGGNFCAVAAVEKWIVPVPTIWVCLPPRLTPSA